MDSKQDNLQNHSKNLFMSPRFADINILIEDKKIPAHKFILSRNEEFQTRMTNSERASGRDILEITDCDIQTFNVYLEYLYTDRVNDEEKTENLLIFADKYRDYKCKWICECEFTKKVSLENAYLILYCLQQNIIV